jgi:hypothetical protein
MLADDEGGKPMGATTATKVRQVVEAVEAARAEAPPLRPGDGRLVLALLEARHNVALAARLAGCGRSTLKRRLADANFVRVLQLGERLLAEERLYALIDRARGAAE